MLCEWCRYVKIPWWSGSLYCQVCRTLRDEVLKHEVEEEIQLIAAIARRRYIMDARRTDYIPGIQRKVFHMEYDGPERRTHEGTIYNRKGYTQHAQFSPNDILRERNRGSIGVQHSASER